MKKKLMVAHAAAALASATQIIGRLPGQGVTDVAQPHDKGFFKRGGPSPAQRVRENARLKRQGGYFNMDLTAALVAFVAVGVVIGLVLSFAIPWLWGVVKPWLHALTA